MELPWRSEEMQSTACLQFAAWACELASELIADHHQLFWVLVQGLGIYWRMLAVLEASDGLLQAKKELQ